MRCIPALVILLAAVSGARGQCDVSEIEKCAPSTLDSGDRFGWSVTVSGDVAVIGAPADDYYGWVDCGSVYFYRYDGSSWGPPTLQRAAVQGHNFLFGSAVHVSGTLAVIGAPGDGAGRVHVYRDNGTSWILEALLTASDGAAGDDFGSYVEVSYPSHIVVGAPEDDDLGASSGSAYVFRYNGSAWTEEVKLTAWDGAASDRFGSDVSIDRNLIVVGAYGEASSRGAAYVFRDDGSTWSSDGKLVASDRQPSDRFGTSVTVSSTVTRGDWIAVGAPMENATYLPDAGAVYVFEDGRFGWVERQKLVQPQREGQALFGWSTAMHTDLVVAGARGAGTGGEVYVFQDDGSGQFLHAFTQKPKTQDTGDDFGDDVMVDSTYVLVGAKYNDDAADLAGAAYFFPRTPGLVLDASPSTVTAGDTLTFDSHFGAPGDFLGLAVLDVNGQPYFQFVQYGTFQAPSYRWVQQATVPTGLAGLNVTFMIFGFNLCDCVSASNPATVTFQ